MATIKRELAIIVLATVVLGAILPRASEPNPDHQAAQMFLDDIASITASLLSGAVVTEDYAGEEDRFGVGSVLLDDGTTATAVLGGHDGRCFIVHWATPSEAGARAGVLDPAMQCAVSAELVEALPSPPLVEFFPGTVPPLSADDLVSRTDASRHGTLDPYPAQRTPTWFVPSVIALIGVISWHVVGITIKVLLRRPKRGRSSKF